MRFGAWTRPLDSQYSKLVLSKWGLMKPPCCKSFLKILDVGGWCREALGIDQWQHTQDKLKPNRTSCKAMWPCGTCQTTIFQETIPLPNISHSYTNFGNCRYPTSILLIGNISHSTSLFMVGGPYLTTNNSFA